MIVSAAHRIASQNNLFRAFLHVVSNRTKGENSATFHCDEESDCLMGKEFLLSLWSEDCSVGTRWSTQVGAAARAAWVVVDFVHETFGECDCSLKFS